MKKERPDASRFCETCGALLRPYYRDGYVLLDLYGDPACYALRPGQTHILRDYTVTVSAEGENVRVRVSSSRFGGSGASPI